MENDTIISDPTKVGEVFNNLDINVAKDIGSDTNTANTINPSITEMVAKGK
jgi:hypothetical protein